MCRTRLHTTVLAVITLLIPHGSARAAEFNWETLTLAWIKLNPDFEFSDRRIESYMQATRRETWDLVRANEFQLAKARAETLKILKQKVAAFNADAEFVVNANLDLGTYDFALQGFPVDQMTESRYWYPASRYSEHMPSSYHVFFANTKAFRLLPMNETQAEAFIKSRTDRYGSVERRVVAAIRFRLKSVKNQDHEFLADIQSMTVYRDRTKTSVLAELTPAAEKRDGGK